MKGIIGPIFWIHTNATRERRKTNSWQSEREVFFSFIPFRDDEKLSRK
jgi:hypothetical protein